MTEPYSMRMAVFLIVASYLFGVAMLYLVVHYLKHQEPDKTYIWTLPRALSEKIAGIPATDPAAYAPSSSRLIAFMGMGVIMILFLASGSLFVWGYMMKMETPDLRHIGFFLTAGVSLFVPYAANQVAGAIRALNGKPPEPEAPQQGGDNASGQAPAPGAATGAGAATGTGATSGAVTAPATGGAAPPTAGAGAP